MVLMPFRPSGKPCLDQSLLNTHICCCFAKQLSFYGVVTHLLLCGSRRPWSRSFYSSFSLMPANRRVSQRSWRSWDAGVIWVVQGYRFFFRVRAVLLLLAMSQGPLVMLTDPWLCSIRCKLDISSESSYNFILERLIGTLVRD